jgi:hypothetical protein
MEHLHRKFNYTLSAILFLVLTLSLINVVHSQTQKTFTLDLDNPVFKYEEYNLNGTNKNELIYNKSQNMTLVSMIPKNSTILDSEMTLTGLSSPSQTYATDIVYSVAIGDLTSDPGNEIVAGTYSPLNVFNFSGDIVWSYSDVTEFYGVTVGNVTSDPGNEVVAGSSDGKVYALNSSGNHIWNFTTGDIVYSVAIGDLTSDPGNETVAGSNNGIVFVINSTGNEVWSNWTGGAVFAVAIGDVNSSIFGNEVVIGNHNKTIIIFDSDGNEVWRYVAGDNIDSLAVGNVTSDPGNEVVFGAEDGKIYLLNSTGDLIWNYSCGDWIYSLAIGDVTSDPGNEIIAGSRDDKVYILNSSNSLIWSYTANNDIRGVTVGNVTSDPGNEVVAGSKDSNIYILNFEYYPTPYLDVGDNSDWDWSYPTKLRNSVSVSNSSLASGIQNYLSVCTPDGNGNCEIPFVFYSESTGDLEVSNVNITYDYNASEAISYEEQTNTWSRINNVKVNESVGYEVKNISFGSPCNSITINYVKINDTATLCDYNGTTHSNETINGINYCSIGSDSVSPGSRLLWDNTMDSSIPIYMNETSPTIEQSTWKKNVSIWNITPTVFTNIIANTTLNDTLINSNETLRVFWNDNWCDITPSSEDTNCNNPDYNPTNEKNCGLDIFYVCKKDTDNNPGVIDYFKWIQPHSSTTLYEVSGSLNNEANLTNGNVTPSTGIWGSEFNFTVNVSDPDGDNVTVDLMIYLSNLDVWERMGSKNTTRDTSTTPETILFTVYSNKSWSGNNLFRFDYRDFNDTTFFHGWQSTGNYGGPNTNRHNVSIIYGYDKQVNRTGSNWVSLVVGVNDTDNATMVGEGVNCRFWITTTNGTSFDSWYDTTTNSSGYCNHSFDPNSSYSIGKQWWKAGTNEDTYYLNQNSTNFTVEIYGQLNINLTETTANKNFTRTQNDVLEAKIFDDNNTIVTVEDYNCTWYVNDTEIGNSKTNSSGYCKYIWNFSCSYGLDSYPINVTLSGNAQYYYINKSKDDTNSVLKDNLNVNIINPFNTSIIYEQQNVTLNSTVSDSCGIPEPQNYDVEWYFVQGGVPLCPTVNPVAGGLNTTWELNVSCFPREQIVTVNATGNSYNSGSDYILVYIYGWSEVSVKNPIQNETINRSDPQVGNHTSVVCRVIDNINNGGVDNYPVNFWYIDESFNEHFNGTEITNSSGYATFDWTISNDTVPDGKYTVKCNISHSSTVYYNVSIAEDNVSVTIIGHEDSQPPLITGVSADSVEVYNNVTIEANVTDYYGVDQVWANITYPNGSRIVHSLQNITSDIQYGTWKTTLINLTKKGDYDFTLYANDTTGNEPSSTKGWFEVYLPIRFYGNTTNAVGLSNISVDFTFYRSGTNTLLHHFSTNSSYGEYNETVHNRTYDIEARVSNHTIKFISVNITEDTNNSINFDIFLKTYAQITKVRHKIKTLAIRSTLNYSSVNLTFNYSDEISYLESQTNYNELSIDVYRCSEWNFTDLECYGDWENIGGNVDKFQHIVWINISSLSGFVIADTAECGDTVCDLIFGESCLNCEADCGPCPPEDDGTPGGTGGGRTGISPVCNNGICEAGENVYNCPEDCGYAETMFSLRTNLTNVELNPGEEKTYGLWITNNVKYGIDASISIVGTASSLITLEKKTTNIEKESQKLVNMYVRIPDDIEPGVYTGDIVVKADGKTESIPISITVSLKGAVSLEVYVETLNKLVGLNETAKFRIIINKYGLGRINTDLIYIIKEFDTEKEIYREEEKKTIEAFQSLVKSIPLSNINISTGHYLFEVITKYGDIEVSATDDFEVVESFWTTENITRLMLITVGTTSIIAFIYARRRYIAWKLSKARYIFPIDMDKLPKGTVWLGKIAETKNKAYFDMNDLMTHVLTAGATGSGKSVSAMIFVEELLEEKIPIVVFDPTAQWTGFVRPCRDPKLIRYYKEFGLNRRDTKPYKGMIYEVTDPNVKIDFKKYMNPGEITVFTLNKLRPGQYDDAVRSIIDTIFAQGWEESTKLRMVIVFDEVHRLLEKYGGKGGYVSLERACREFRKWGIGLIMASQVLSDFKEAIKGNVLTEVQLHTKSLGDLKRVETKYGFEYAKRVTRQEVGIGMMQNPKYNEGRPWFVSFRPTVHSPHKIPDADMNTYREYADLLRIIESKIGSIERTGKDVFELETELKLAKDKLKKGRFRMAKIYIDSLNKHLSEG